MVYKNKFSNLVRIFSEPKAKNYSKENFKRLREIQEKCKKKEEEKLKFSQKKMGPNRYKNVKSKVFTVSGLTSNNIESEKLNDERHSVATCESSLSSLPPSASQCGDENSNKSPSPNPDLDENQLNEIRGRGDRVTFNCEDKDSSSLKEMNLEEKESNQNPSNTDILKEFDQADTHDDDASTHQPLSAMSYTKTENNDNISTKSVVSNSGSAKSNASDAKSIKSSKEMKMHQLGEIPKYLIQRQYEQKEEELKRKKEVDPSIPPGHVVLSEEERISTLEKFEKNKEELLREYIQLPFCCDTLRAKKRKEMLEKELTKMDEGIEIFSKNRVLIKTDE